MAGNASKSAFIRYNDTTITLLALYMSVMKYLNPLKQNVWFN